MQSEKLSFKADGVIRDWQMLLEMLLQWEMWLKSEKMAVKDVKRAKQKHKWLMFLIKKVARRTEGLGLKITKFHTILHYSQDILNFGVPMEMDTGSNESGHKIEKQLLH